MMLYCFVQNYHWGKKGNTSEVARLAGGNRSAFVVDANKPYAELWMGTHKSGPSVIIDNGLLLVDWIKKNPNVLGYEVREKFGGLPFLFKVLSIGHPLSIQAHPSKEHARLLHEKMPQTYKDPNHKPEMAIALTPFEALCGFRPYDEIKKFFQEVVDLRSLIGNDLVAEFLASDEANLQTKFRACFHALMKAPDELVKTKVRHFIETLRTIDQPTRQHLLAELVERLNSEYPGDIGVFGPFLFNYIILQPGEAIFLNENEPHSYISGDCVECMACSDNVVRAGLTPKEKDVDTLCNMLSYISEPGYYKHLPHVKENQFSVLYSPPVIDFAVAKISIPLQTENYYMTVRRSASIAVVIKGKGTLNKKEFQPGSVFFMHAGQTNFITATEPDVLIFQAMANI